MDIGPRFWKPELVFQLQKVPFHIFYPLLTSKNWCFLESKKGCFCFSHLIGRTSASDGSEWLGECLSKTSSTSIVRGKLIYNTFQLVSSWIRGPLLGFDSILMYTCCSAYLCSEFLFLFPYCHFYANQNCVRAVPWCSHGLIWEQFLVFILMRFCVACCRILKSFRTEVLGSNSIKP